MAVVPLPAATNSAVPKTASSATTATNDAVRAELEQLMEDDDATLDEVDKWIRNNQAMAAKGSAEDNLELNKRIHARLDAIGKRYQDFLKHHPDNADAHLAYGTFLNDTGDEDSAAAEYEIARK